MKVQCLPFSGHFFSEIFWCFTSADLYNLPNSEEERSQTPLERLM